MKRIKRMISLAVALVLVFGMIPLQTKAAQGDKLAAITFDDGPSGRYTPQLLDGLKKRGVKATFFVLGQNAVDNLDVIERAYNEGHEIASHSWSHPDLTTLSDSSVRNQLNSTAEVLDKVCGEGRYLLRPPYGNASTRVRNIADVPLIYWTVDPEDWKYRNAYTVRDNIVENTFDGAIILVHDIYGSSVEGALMAIDELQDEGYEFVTISQLHRRRDVPLEDREWHYSCRANGNDYGYIAKPEVDYTTTDKKTMTVTIKSESDAPIYYTTDGTIPKQDAKKYTGPFKAPYGCTITAFSAYNMNGDRSEMTTFAPGQGAKKGIAPNFKLVNGKIEMTAVNADADIYYTLDGSRATEKSTRYTGPVSVPKGSYIHAVTAGGYYSTSPETIMYYSGRGVLFDDAEPGSWYFDNMDRLASMGLMSGLGNNIYAPHAKLTRGMLVTMLYAYADEKLEKDWKQTSPFVDLDRDEWYSEAAEWAYRNSITKGYDDNTFRPNNNLTRQELAVIIDGFLAHRDKPLLRGPSCEGKFQDYGAIHGWALSSVEALVQAGMLTGDGKNLNPVDSATRAQIAAILCKVMEYEESYKPPETEPTTPPTDATETTVPGTETQPTENGSGTQPTESTAPTAPTEEKPDVETTETMAPTVATETTENTTETQVTKPAA